MLTKGNSPKASGVAFRYDDASIIEFFRLKGQGLLNYYRPAVNFHNIKKLVDYHMR